MINTIMLVLKLVLYTLPFILAILMNSKVNLARELRSKQFAAPIVCILYCIVAMIFIEKIKWLVLTIIKKVGEWLQALATIDMIPIQASQWLYKTGMYIKEQASSMVISFVIVVLINTAIVLVYIVIKKIALSIMKRKVKTDGILHQFIAERFYEYFTERNVWVVKKGYGQARTFLKALYYGAFVISCVLLMVSRYYFNKGMLSSWFYPVFGILLVGELYFYLNGLLKKEYCNDVLGEDENVYKIVNYSHLRTFLRNIFPDKLLAENTTANNEMGGTVTHQEVLQELEESDNPMESNFANFFQRLSNDGLELDHNYMYSALELLKGKSILFNNPFYNDFIPYIFYPMNRILLQKKKVLVILGRHAIEDNILEWINEGTTAITNVPSLWNAGILTDKAQDLDIGIITRSDTHNIKIHEANEAFFHQVDFCVIIEPSKLISTAQIGLNSLIKRCRENDDRNITYCAFDKNCDGLVDALSHILMTNISEVSATNKHLGTSSYMCWTTDEEYVHHRMFPNISRYLGMGTELSFAGLKNQVSNVEWYGGEVFPVTDIKWIDRQYYYDLLSYSNLPTDQNIFNEMFKASSDFWSAKLRQNNYITVEDEANNMFEVLRTFSTRTTEQGFINVISGEYILKDYMAMNNQIFESDAKAIPYIVADYARTNRNVALRLLLMLSTAPLLESKIQKELILIGRMPSTKVTLKEQLWNEIYNCYASVEDVTYNESNYIEIVLANASKEINIKGVEKPFSIDDIVIQERYNIDTEKVDTFYYIVNEELIENHVKDLRSASYITEDEEGEKHYLGTELYGHIFQKQLPGQFFTYDGKYYEMQNLSGEGRVLVRRAADHITGRISYRQIRNYKLHNVKASEVMGSRQNIDGVILSREYADISVDTPAYFRMNKYNDFKTAKKVEINGIPTREYKNKSILRIELPNEEGKLTSNVKYTITLMLNEIFRTLFAENQYYIVAVTANNVEREYPLTYNVAGVDNYTLDDNSIYIVEDSQLDLGLLISVERNIKRILEIAFDYLDWHITAEDESRNPKPEPQPDLPDIEEMEREAEENKPKKKSFWTKIKDFFKKIFKKKPKKEKPESESVEGESSEEPTGEVPEGESIDVETTVDVTEETTEEVEEEVPENVEEEANDEITEEVITEEVISDEVVETETIEEVVEETAEDVVEETAKEVAEETVKDVVETENEKVDTEESVEDSEIVEKNSEDSEESNFTVGPLFSRSFSFNGTIGYSVESEEDSNENPEATTEVSDENETENDSEEMNPEEVDSENTDSEDVGIETEDEELQNKEDEFIKPYHENHYLLYGFDELLEDIEIENTREYLTGFGVSKNPLEQARKGLTAEEIVAMGYDSSNPNKRYCDFCGAEISGVEYETLADGRDRCMRCSRTAIKTGEEFVKIFNEVKRNMEAFFGIKINAGVKVEMVNSRTLHKRLGISYTPTPGMDGRVLGVAIRDKSGYTLMIENGSPRILSMLTMAHELTHIWQYINWDEKNILNKYGQDLNLEVYEGMAKWVEIQYAYLINEPAIAKQQELQTLMRNDEYGRGFVRYLMVYPMSKNTYMDKDTPFNHIDEPLPLDGSTLSVAGASGGKKYVMPDGKSNKKKRWIILIILLLMIAILFFIFSHKRALSTNGAIEQETTVTEGETSAGGEETTSAGEEESTTNQDDSASVNANKFAYRQLKKNSKKLMMQCTMRI